MTHITDYNLSLDIKFDPKFDLKFDFMTINSSLKVWIPKI